MASLGNEQRSFCHFWDCIQVLHFRLFCWPWWLLHFFWGIPACSSRYNGHLSYIHPFQSILVHWFLECWHSLLPSLVWPLPICLDSWTWHSRFLCNIALYSTGPCFYHQSHPQMGIVFALAPSLPFILSRVIFTNKINRLQNIFIQNFKISNELFTMYWKKHLVFQTWILLIKEQKRNWVHSCLLF